MLLISKFRDYYDTALAGGVDKTIVFRRKREMVEKYPEYLKTSGRALDITRTHRGITYTRHLKNFKVAFCGRIYKGIRVENPQINKNAITADEYAAQYTHCYTLEQYNKAIKGYKQNDLSYWRGRSWGDKRISEKNFWNKEETRLIDDRIILAYSTPEKYGKCKTITMNPKLQSIGFTKIHGSFQAFQEISMYISGVMGVGEKNTITISDKDMRDAKGFDDWSFKNPTRVKDLK